MHELFHFIRGGSLKASLEFNTRIKRGIGKEAKAINCNWRRQALALKKFKKTPCDFDVRFNASLQDLFSIQSPEVQVVSNWRQTQAHTHTFLGGRLTVVFQMPPQLLILPYQRHSQKIVIASLFHPSQEKTPTLPGLVNYSFDIFLMLHH